MKKWTVIRCPKCDCVKKHGTFVQMTDIEMLTLQIHQHEIKITDETCTYCCEGIDPSTLSR